MEALQELIVNSNLKMTTARVAILELLTQANRPLCYEDIKAKLKMDKATFYRNILKFEEESIINSFESNDKKRYYEVHKTPHAHFICTVCSKIECVKEQNIQLPGYTIENIIIKGICPACRN